MLPRKARLLHPLILFRQFSSLGEAVILLTGADEPNLIPLELFSVASGLVNEDLALGLANAAFQAPLPLGGFVEGVMLALEINPRPLSTPAYDDELRRMLFHLQM